MKNFSPFEDLQIPKPLVCEFFGVFSRFEFSLKEMNFIRENSSRIEPSWRCFAKSISQLTAETESDLSHALKYLTSEIPQVQISKDKWEPRPLHGDTQIEKSIEAITRIRNNLFHGGKHTPHSPPERDKKLVEMSLVVLYALLSMNEDLRNIYKQPQKM